MVGFGRGKEHGIEAAQPQSGAMDSMASALVGRLLSTGFDGKLSFDSAHAIAEQALRKHGGDPERAVEEIVADHRKLAATNGFVTGLGGLITMPVALPANVLGFYLLATRMAAAIAAVRGHDLHDPRLRSAVLLTLVGAEANDLLQKAGVVATGRLAGLASQRLPPAALMIVNKAVGFRLINQVGAKMLARVGKAIPLAGGVIGAGLDLVLLNKIAVNARQQFPQSVPQLPAT